MMNGNRLIGVLPSNTVTILVIYFVKNKLEFLMLGKWLQLNKHLLSTHA
jgi:hypothetical protein